MGAEITERTVAQEKRRNGERTEKTEKLKRLIEDELSSPFNLRYSVSPVSPCPPHPSFPSKPALRGWPQPVWRLSANELPPEPARREPVYRPRRRASPARRAARSCCG